MLYLTEKFFQNACSDAFCLDGKFSDVACKMAYYQQCLYSEFLLLDKEVECEYVTFKETDLGKNKCGWMH